MFLRIFIFWFLYWFVYRKKVVLVFFIFMSIFCLEFIWDYFFFFVVFILGFSFYVSLVDMYYLVLLFCFYFFVWIDLILGSWFIFGILRVELNEINKIKINIGRDEKRIVSEDRVGIFVRLWLFVNRCKMFIFSFDSMISLDSDVE